MNSRTGSLFYKTGSVIEGIDGSIKLMWVIFWSVFTFMFMDLRIFVALIIAGLILFRVSRIPWRKAKVLFIFVLIFTAFNSIFLFLVTPTYGSELTGTYTTLFQAGVYQLTYENLFYILTISVKYIALLPITIVFLFSTHPSLFASSLDRIGVPYKIAYTINIALRYIPDVQQEFNNITSAQEARGVAFDKKDAKLFQRLKNYTTVLIPMLLTSFDRIEIVSNAMDLRGFGRYKKRTWYVREPYTKIDMVALAAGIAFLLLGIYLKATSPSYFWYPFN